MVVGHGAMLIGAVLIARHKTSLLSVADAVFWTAVAATALLRRLDVTHFAGCTAYGHPATVDDWRRYATRLLPAVALAGWLVAHVVARL